MHLFGRSVSLLVSGPRSLRRSLAGGEESIRDELGGLPPGYIGTWQVARGLAGGAGRRGGITLDYPMHSHPLYVYPEGVGEGDICEGLLGGGDGVIVPSRDGYELSHLPSCDVIAW